MVLLSDDLKQAISDAKRRFSEADAADKLRAQAAFDKVTIEIEDKLCETFKSNPLVSGLLSGLVNLARGAVGVGHTPRLYHSAFTDLVESSGLPIVGASGSRFDLTPGGAFSVSEKLRAALEHERLVDGRAAEGRMFFWHDWHLCIWSCGCKANPRRCAQTKEFSDLVANALEDSGMWLSRKYKYAQRRGYTWVAAKWRLRARCFQEGEVRFYVDPNAEHGGGPAYAWRPEQAASFFTKGLFKKIQQRINDALISVGFFNGTRPELVGLDRQLYQQRTSGHWRPGLALSITNPGRDDVDAEGRQIREGDRKATYEGGRLFVGTAVYHLNSCWCLVAECGERQYASSWALFDFRPGLPHRFRGDGYQRVCRLLQDAVARENFQRAATLKRIRDRWWPTLKDVLVAWGPP